ncbi:MAG: phosphonate C-P lyase system protein PhnG [Aestuariivirgaceae bacterium]|nr:phosphonate C-P lyase system protein PhnG [Aestuariivirgaceae bacterium]
METHAQRKDWMRVLAHADWAELEPLMKPYPLPDNAAWLRPPETGMVMMRARAGGTGMAFNTGEATVTRCAVQLNGGIIGHGYILGRNAAHAQAAALLDALLQLPDHADDIHKRVIEVLRSKIETRRDIASRKAAATRVDFFTLVRGED